MYPVKYFAVTSQQVTKRPNAVLKIEATPNASATSTLYLQVHDSCNVPAEGSVPLKSWPMGETGYKEFKGGELEVTEGLYICLSSTAATKTLAVGGSDVNDVLMVELEKPDTTTTISGSKVTGGNVSLVWTNGTNGKLRRVIVTPISVTGTKYIMLFAKTSAATGDIPIARWSITQAGGTLKISFGESGITPRATVAGVTYNGAYLILSSTADTATLELTDTVAFLKDYITE